MGNCNYNNLNKGWRDTIDGAIADKAWDEYDYIIVSEISECNTRLKINVDWRLIKAMIWVESGGPKSEHWKKRVMQIGNPGDAGSQVIRAGALDNVRTSEGSELVMSKATKTALGTGKFDEPKNNILAGIAYLLTRMASTEWKTVLDTQDPRELEYQVVAGDSFDRIAKKVGTTIDVLQQMNPKSKILHAKDVLKYKKAQIKRLITSWRTFDTATIAARYNTAKGDTNYACKLEYALDAMKKLKRDNPR